MANFSADEYFLDVGYVIHLNGPIFSWVAMSNWQRKFVLCQSQCSVSLCIYMWTDLLATEIAGKHQ